MADNNDIPRGFKILGVAWPIAAASLAIGVAGVRADAQVDGVETRVAEIEKNGPAVVRERLARMEAIQVAQSQQLDRMEKKLDDLDKRSRERNLNGL